MTTPLLWATPSNEPGWGITRSRKPQYQPEVNFHPHRTKQVKTTTHYPATPNFHPPGIGSKRNSNHAQVLAKRANSQLSTGPTTDDGKAAVSRNATSHGLSGQTFTLLPHENPEDFQDLVTSLEQEHAPQSATENFLVTELT